MKQNPKNDKPEHPLTGGQLIDANLSGSDGDIDPYKDPTSNDSKGSKKFKVNLNNKGRNSDSATRSPMLLGHNNEDNMEPLRTGGPFTPIDNFNGITPESLNNDPQTTIQQLWIVTKLSIGPIISMIFYMLVQLINTYYIGHSNDSSLIAGVGMGNMLINVLAFAIMQGLNGALETLVSRSYGLSND